MQIYLVVQCSVCTHIVNRKALILLSCKQQNNEILVDIISNNMSIDRCSSLDCESVGLDDM
jgi:hypothetical protein